MSQMQELTELKNLVIQSLEANGSLAKIRAQIRASVFNVVDQQDGQPKKPSPFFWENNKAQSIYDMQGGREILELIKDFLQTFDMHYTLSIFQSESNLREDVNREALAKKFNLDLNDGKPLLHQAVFNQKPPRDSIKSNNEDVQLKQQQEVQQQQQQLQQKRQQEIQKQEQQKQEQARIEQQRKEEQLKEQKRLEQLREQERQEQLRREQQERKEQERREEQQRQEQLRQEQIKEQQRQEQLRQQEQARKEQEKKEQERQKQEMLKEQQRQEQLRQEQLQKQELLKQQQKMEEQRKAINPPQKTEEYEDEQFDEEVEEDVQMYDDMGESGLKKQGQEGGFGSSEEFMQGSQSQGFDMTVDSMALEEFDYYEDVEDM